ncbi:MAG TPA: HAD-IA family hydrolase [Verrucomicrobiae bacterium]|jgi:phosphoglycolate phosphatase|nr:HAD-IA family hydrolase [Verrucomicrobiae bacterium]
MIRTNRPIPAARIQLLIFDLDGTLVDSRTDLANSINAMLRNFRRPELPPEVIASYIGDGAPMLVRRSLGDPDDEAFVQQALLYFLDYYREHKLDYTYVYDGVKESLETIRNSRNGAGTLKMAVLSNKPVFPSRAIVEALGLGSYFFQVYGGNSFHTKKPDPAGVHALLGEAGARPEQTVIIGDSDIDICTANNAGIYSVGVTYGLAPHTLHEVTPDVVLDHPRELAEVFAV